MFEVGKQYSYKMWEDSDDGGVITEHRGWEVVEVNHPLIKVRLTQHTAEGGVTIGEEIINTASLAFVSAREMT